MCGGFEYSYIDPETKKRVIRKVYFPIPKVKIPVETEAGIEFCQWGKRQGEEPELDIPVTGWARLISLKEGKWNQYNPRRVRIPAIRWMEKDSEKTSHWFDLEPGKALLGVQIEKKTDNETRRFIYIVTKPSSGVHADVHHRMPVLTAAGVID